MEKNFFRMKTNNQVVTGHDTFPYFLDSFRSHPDLRLQHSFHFLPTISSSLTFTSSTLCPFCVLSVMDYVTSGMEWFVHKGRFMFYLVTPEETSYPDFKLVPRLVVEVRVFLPLERLIISCDLPMISLLDVSIFCLDVRTRKCCPVLVRKEIVTY